MLRDLQGEAGAGTSEYIAKALDAYDKQHFPAARIDIDLAASARLEQRVKELLTQHTVARLHIPHRETQGATVTDDVKPANPHLKIGERIGQVFYITVAVIGALGALWAIGILTREAVEAWSWMWVR